jgi:hypothetical protein
MKKNSPERYHEGTGIHHVSRCPFFKGKEIRSEDMKWISFFLLFLVVLLPGILSSQYLSITKVDEIGKGPYHDVFVRGNYAYCAAEAAGIDIIDISNPCIPRKIGHLNTPGFAVDVHVSGDYAYVADGHEGLQVIDVSNPYAPRLVGNYDTPSNKLAGKVYIYGNYAYVGNINGDLQVIDISNPSSPRLAASLYEGGEAEGIYVRGNYAYYVESSYYAGSVSRDGTLGSVASCLLIIDISNPYTPVEKGCYCFWGEVYAFDVSGNYAYMTIGWDFEDFLVVDISDPSRPVQVGTTRVFGSQLAIKGNYVYITRGVGIQVVKVSNPTKPRLVATYEIQENSTRTYGIYIEGRSNYAYVGDNAGGLTVLDISNPTAPLKKGYFHNLACADARDIHINGNYAFVADYREGLKVVDISNPASPGAVGRGDMPPGKYFSSRVKKVSADNNYACIIDWCDDIYAFDISTPANPVLTGAYELSYLPDCIDDLYVKDNYAYVANGKEGLKVYNISGPSLLQVGSFPVANARDVYIAGNYAYAAADKEGLLVLDISNAPAIKEVGNLELPEPARCIFVSGTYAYISGYEDYFENKGSFYIIDISDPSAPVLEGSSEEAGSTSGIYVSGNYAFLVNYDGLTVLDISNPFSPKLAGKYSTVRGTNGVWVCDNYIYLAAGELITLEFSPCATLPQISLSRTTMDFAAVSSGMTSGSQSLVITNSGEGNLNWRADSDQKWLGCSPSSGATGGQVFVAVDPSSLSQGNYIGTITFSDSLAVNSPQTVTVTLRVYGADQAFGPFGEFDTPIDGSMVSGSVPVSGWALAQVGVQSVKIYHLEGNSKIYIGEAVFIEDARPDIRQAYPQYPDSRRAGWGYLLLTNLLPNRGNGIFTLQAVAADFLGYETILGTKTITCDNANAVNPFGYIDTPTPGGIASGSRFANFGWALTPLPNTIPTEGSTIRVWVDGVPLGNPIYNRYREDIAALFPECNNSSGAGGYFYLDTTRYKNGVHTISWSVIDDAGNTGGIGSRYFTIQNLGGSVSHVSTKSSTVSKIHRSMSNVDMNQAIVDEAGPIRVKKGYHREIESQMVYPDESRNITIELRELERLEIHLSEGTGGLAPLSNAPLSNASVSHVPLSNGRKSSTSVWNGFQVIGNRYSPLPIGSNLDRETGIFTWQPGAGFIGDYRLVFLVRDGYSRLTMKRVLVKIVPRN